MNRCKNSFCNDELRNGECLPLCPSCRHMGKQGLFWGALIGAIIVKLIHLFA